MEIKNLAQLKRVIQEKREFIIRVHRQEKFLGQKRIPNVVQSNGFYSVISGQPEHEVSCANHGKGSWIDFGKATQWEFQEETCSMYLPEMEHIPENLIWTIEFCKDKKNIPQKLSCSILCNAYYHGELLLPEAIKTFPEALEYAKDHLDEIPLGEMNYIENSDVLDQENCELVAADSEEIPEDSSKENGLKSSKEEWWRIIEGIKEHEGWISQGNFYTRAGYIQEVYRYAIKAVDRLKYYQESVLLYAVKHQKKHFLKLYEENTELFLELPWNSILFQKAFYEEYVNLNTLNFQNLKECRKIKECSAIEKTDMRQKEYTFAEIKLFAVCPDRAYIRLYHKLNYRRVDDRLRVMQEVVKKRLLDKVTSEETLERVAAFLSHKPLSKWVKEELGNISGLVGMDILDLFLSWEEVVRFLPEVKNGFQLRYLIANKEKLSGYPNFQSVYAELVKNDPHWEWMKNTFAFSDSFIREHEANIQTFLEQGGSEILYEFYKGDTGQTEMLRRLLVAELMGKFKDLKYHDADLEKELAFPISEKQMKLWAENLQLQRKEWKIWEEDRFLPVMQIGELPDKTCLSYKTGMYRKCLLSCFDSNKKIIYISYQGKIVLRAILRLTKASEEKMERENKEFQFVDFTKDTGKKEKPEQLVLFLEKAYVKGISDRVEQEMFKLLFRMVKEKAGRLSISLLISRDYFGNIPSGWFQKESRYIYISATKGKEQYLDSLGGNHGIASEGKYLQASVFRPISPEKCAYERMEGEEFSEIS